MKLFLFSSCNILPFLFYHRILSFDLWDRVIIIDLERIDNFLKYKINKVDSVKMHENNINLIRVYTFEVHLQKIHILLCFVNIAVKFLWAEWDITSISLCFRHKTNNCVPTVICQRMKSNAYIGNLFTIRKKILYLRF